MCMLYELVGPGISKTLNALFSTKINEFTGENNYCSQPSISTTLFGGRRWFQKQNPVARDSAQTSCVSNPCSLQVGGPLLQHFSSLHFPLDLWHISSLIAVITGIMSLWYLQQFPPMPLFLFLKKILACCSHIGCVCCVFVIMIKITVTHSS